MDAKWETHDGKYKPSEAPGAWEKPVSLDRFHYKVETMQQQVEELHRRAIAARAQPHVSLTDLIEELNISLEELQVAEEELRQQNEELLATRQVVEAERQRYRELFDFAPDGYLVTDTAGAIQEANRAAAALLNVSQHFLVGKPLLVFLAEAERKSFYTRLSRLLVAGQVEQWEVRVQPSRGAAFDAGLTVAAVRDSRGQVVSLRWLLRDITERKRTEAALREEVEIASALARVGHELIALLDTPLILERLCYLTAEALECDCSHTILWQPQEAVYKVVASYGDTLEQRETLRSLRVPPGAVVGLTACLEREEVVELQATGPEQFVPQDLLQQFGITAVLSLALWRGKEIIGIQTAGSRRRKEFSPHQQRIARGISQLASLALANAKLLEELEQANRLKEDVVGTMSHELRTPLNIIIGYNDLLCEGAFGPLTAEQSDILRRVDKSARDLLDLIIATLDLSRLQSQQLPLNLQEVRVAELLAELETEAGHFHHHKPAVSLEWQVAPALPPLHTDPVELKMVLKNLITNALKFTEEGSVTVTASPQGEGVKFCVADTGIGIAREHLSLIFDPFRQVDSSPNRRQGGVGLGLYIVRQLLKVLGGTIAVESELGKGSTFRVWVPQKSVLLGGGRKPVDLASTL